MANSYAGITFEVVSEGVAHPVWTRKRRVQRTEVPAGSFDYLVDTGSGNLTRRVRVAVRGISAAGDFAALVAAQGITKRTLVLLGETSTGVMLTNVEGETKRDFGAHYEADLTFEREA